MENAFTALQTRLSHLYDRIPWPWLAFAVRALHCVARYTLEWLAAVGLLVWLACVFTDPSGQHATVELGRLFWNQLSILGLTLWLIVRFAVFVVSGRF